MAGLAGFACQLDASTSSPAVIPTLLEPVSLFLRTLCSVTACSAPSALHARTVPSHQKSSRSGVTAQRQEPDLQPAGSCSLKVTEPPPSPSSCPPASWCLLGHLGRLCPYRVQRESRARGYSCPQKPRSALGAWHDTTRHDTSTKACNTVLQYARDAPATSGNGTFSADRRRVNTYLQAHHSRGP